MASNEVKQPDPKLHQLISFAKSGIRVGTSAMVVYLALAGTGTALGLVAGLAIGYGIAELVGVVEELV